MNSVWSSRSISTSTGWGSLTFSTSSDLREDALGVGGTSAPWAMNCSSLIALPSPAPACTNTSCPRTVSSRTPRA